MGELCDFITEVVVYQGPKPRAAQGIFSFVHCFIIYYSAVTDSVLKAVNLPHCPELQQLSGCDDIGKLLHPWTSEPGLFNIIGQAGI